MTPAKDWLPPSATELQKIPHIVKNRHTATATSHCRYTRDFPVQDERCASAFLAYCRAAPCRLVPRFFPTGASIRIAGRSVPLERPRTRQGVGLRVSLSAGHLAMHRTACPCGYPRAGIRPIRPASEGCNPLCTEVRRVRFSFQGAGIMIGVRCGICRRTALKSPQDFKVH